MVACMASITFSNLQRLARDSDARRISCIAEPRSRRCMSELQHDRQRNAIDLLHRDKEDLTLKQVRDIINCLLCEAHQKTYTHKNKLELEWETEFPTLDFSKHRSPSPFSLSGKSRRLHQETFHAHGTTTPTPSPRQVAQTRPSYHSTPHLSPDTPEILRTRIDRSVSAPQILQFTSENETPTESRTLESSPKTPVEDGHDPELPLTGSSAARRDDVLLNTLSILDETPAQGISDRTEARNSAQLRVDPEPSTRPADVGNDISSTDQFVLGDAASWSPWTIREEVRQLILEPLPRPKDKGCIYVIQNETKTHVKIGYTTRKVEVRMKEIAKKHGIRSGESNRWTLPGIPYVQLLRLEALVLADLAYHQRDLFVRSGGKQVRRKEWFEVSFSTAVKTVCLWWDIMQNLGLKPGIELHPDIADTLRSSAEFSPEMCGASEDVATWARINSNHDQRITMWTDLLLAHRHKANPGLFHIMIWGAMGCFCIWVLPVILEVFPKVVHAVQAILLIALARLAAAALNV